MTYAEDLMLKRFGKLTVVGKTRNKENRPAWKCLCDCGNVRTNRASPLKRGKIKSCGCDKGKKPQDIVERFNSKLIKSDNKNDCWIWVGRINEWGYGQIKIKNKYISAHRLSWQLFKGQIPESLCVLHHCDIPRCVNPNHLFLGTHNDNSIDKCNKNRQWRPLGMKHSNSKLKDKDILTIRLNPLPQNALAKKMGVVPSVIGGIRQRKIWAHIDDTLVYWGI